MVIKSAFFNNAEIQIHYINKLTAKKGLNNMFQIWAKLIKDGRILKDIVISNKENKTRTQKVFWALEEACYEFDLQKPIWLDKNIMDFKLHKKVRFMQDNFIESIDFDYLEFQVVEED